MQTRFTLTGTVQGAAQPDALLVEAHESTGSWPDLVEVATPDRFGRFTMDLDTAYLRQLFLDRPVELVFNVFQGRRLVARTLDRSAWSLASLAGEVRIPIGDSPSDGGSRPAPCVVRGRVHASNLGEGWRVRVYDHALRGAPVRLAEAKVGADGTYEASYARAALQRLGKLHADLRLEVVDAKGKVRHTSPVVPHARPTLVADVVLDAAAARGPSTFALIDEALRSRLRGAAPGSLTAAEVTSLADSAGVAGIYVARFAGAHRLATALAAGRPAVHATPELAFALVADGVPATVAAVGCLRAVQVRRHVGRSVARNHVSPVAGKVLDRLLADLRAWAIDRGATPPPETVSDGKARVAAGSHRSLHALLSVGLSAAHADAAVASWFAHEGPSSEWWAALPSVAGFADAAVQARLKLTLQLGALSRNHLPLVRHLLGTGLAHGRDLARYTEPDWVALVSGPIGVPAGTPGKAPADRAAAYARHLAHAVEAAFPTALVADRMRRAPRPAEARALAFLQARPDFELGSASVRKRLTSDPAALQGIADPVATVRELHRLQRVFRLTEGPDRLGAMRTLLDAGLDSAVKIAQLGRGAFLARVGAGLGPESQALQVWRRAQGSAAQTHTAMAYFRGDLQIGSTSAVGPGHFHGGPTTRAVPEAGVPDLATLFGRLDFCSCEHCRSVLSPTAYLVDLLHFLEGRSTSTSGTTAWDLLVRRRSDLPLIELTCANTETELPTIDVVNEVLEHAVTSALPEAERANDPHDVPWLGDPFPIAAPWPEGRQTRGTADDLAVHPEHQYPAAYARLAAASYPWTLPFDLGDEESRAYLSLVGAKRLDVMEALDAGDPTLPLTDDRRQAQAREHLGIGDVEWTLLTTALPLANGPTAWDPSGTWSGWATLDHVSVADILDRAGLAYEDLSECLRSDFVNPAEDGWRVEVRLGVLDQDGTHGACDLDMAVLGAPEGVSASDAQVRARLQAVLVRLPRFVRLMRRLDWAAFELDKAILAFRPTPPADALPAESVTRLAEVDRLRRDLRRAAADLVPWWSRLATDSADDDVPSQYDRLFQNPGVTNPVDAAFALNATRTELADPTTMLAELEPLPTDPSAPIPTGVAAVRTLGSSTAAVAGALRVSADVLTRLLGTVPLPTAGTDPRVVPLSLEVLSRLSREVALAKAVGLSVPDALALRNLYDATPFASPAETQRFADEAAAARAASLELRDVDALLRCPAPVPDDAAAGATLRALRAELQRTAAETAPSTDVDGQVLAALLSSLVAETVTVPRGNPPVDTPIPADAAVDLAVRFVAGPGADVVARWQEEQAAGQPGEATAAVTAWSADNAAGWAVLLSPADMGEWMPAAVNTHLIDPAWQPAPADFDPAEGPAGTTRFEYVQRYVLKAMRATLGPQRVIAALAEALDLPGDVADDLLRRYVVADPAGPYDPPLGPTDAAWRAFVDPTFATADDPAVEEGTVDPLPGLFPGQTRTLRRLHAVARLLTGLGAVRTELPVVFSTGPATGWLDPVGLPVTEVTDPAELRSAYSAWRRLREAYRLRGEIGGATGPLFPILQLAQGRPDVDSSAEWVGAPDAPGLRETAILDVLLASAGWPEADLDFLAGASGFSMLEPAPWKDEQWWSLLLAAVRLVQRTGLAAEQLWAVARPANTPAGRLADAAVIKQSVRAKVEDTEWPTAARPVRDGLRTRQRDALVAWLLANGVPGAPFEVTDSAELFRALLSDSQSGPALSTSRVREALNAVQLFVQQGMLGLVEGLAFDADDQAAWEWMKLYRVWEANRKVFLWPENWMEPELRDDKSPFYEALEDQLLQGEVTQDTAETAYRSYLEKLDEVARLTVRGTFHEVEPEGEDDPEKRTVDRLHVVACTAATPQSYFHRVLEDGEWGPWAPVEVDIEGRHLVPIVWNRRLYVFWPIFSDATEDPDKKQKVPTPDGKDHSVAQPKSYLEVALAWSQQVNGRWTPKQVTDVLLRSEAQEGTPSRKRYRVAAHVDADSGDLLVMVSSPGNFDEEEQGYIRLSAGDGDARTDQSGMDDLPGLHFWTAEYTDPDGGDMSGTARWNEHDFPDSPLLALPVSYDQLSPEGTVLADMHGAFDLAPLIEQPLGTGLLPLPVLFLRDGRRTFSVEAVEHYGQQQVSEVGAPDAYGPKPDDDWVLETIPDLTPQGGDPGPEAFGFARSLPFDPGPGGALVIGGFAPPPPMELMSARVDRPGSTAAWEFEAEVGLDVSDGSTDSDLSDSRLTVEVIPTVWLRRTFRIRPFFHPYVGTFVRQLNRYGVDGLLAPAPEEGASGRTDEVRFLVRQGQGIKVGPRRWTFDGSKRGYAPTAYVEGFADPDHADYPKEDIDFSVGGAYSLYNWELFFHAPLHIARKLSQNQQFEDALPWFHAIFDPRDTPSPGEKTPQRFWKVKPLYQTFFGNDPAAGNIDQVMALFSEGSNAALVAAVNDQIAAWVDNPFDPWAIARLRWSAFQKTVVEKYLDNLIAWGDSLFRQDTTESVNEALLLYVLASEILGDRPEQVETQEPAALRYVDLREDLDAFSNALVDVEDALAVDPTPSAWDDPPPLLTPTLYFCVPPNDTLLAYWDTVDDRLYKIRNSLNIDGEFRTLALFDPPIDPMALVRAVAGGMSLSAALSALRAPLPQHRYATLSARASELCADVRSLGSLLLSCLEKQDAEALARLRSTHELALLDGLTDVREQHVKEAEEAQTALEKSEEVVQERIDTYKEWIDVGLIPTEELQLSAMAEASQLQMDALSPLSAAGSHGLFPTFSSGTAGFGGSPEITVAFGGGNLAALDSADAQDKQTRASEAGNRAGAAGIQAGQERREADWQLQHDLAEKELAHVKAQIEVAKVRKKIAETELTNHLAQRDRAAEADVFLRDKFTNRELYDWMVTQVSSTYFQAWQLALDLARKAERAWQYEVQPPSPPAFVRGDSWDSLKKGLLAGERLHLDLRRMDAAWLDQTKRDHELLRHVSLAQVDPAALQRLKATGTCEVSMPETFFDLDCPGHYLRRIKSVAVSIPCVAGPFAPVHCTLTMLSSVVRRSPRLDGGAGAAGYGRPDPDDDRFLFLAGAVQSIVTSSGQQDAGLFETHLQDPRYLPFEGQGVAESRWRIALPATFRALDYETIADVVLHLRYTARDGGVPLRDASVAAAQERLEAMTAAAEGLVLRRAISLRTENPAEWRRWFDGAPPVLDVALSQDRFPFPWQRYGTVQLLSAELVLFGMPTLTGDPGAVTLSLACQERDDGETSPLPAADLPLTRLTTGDDRVLHGSVVWVAQDGDEPAPTGRWRLSVTALPAGSPWAAQGTPLKLSPDAVKDAWLVVQYRVVPRN
jgi:hypothetical protein